MAVEYTEFGNSGFSTCVDDNSIAQADYVARRVPAALVIFDQNLGRRRPSSQAFCDGNDGSPMTVGLMSRMKTVRDGVKNHPRHSLVKLKVSLLRDLDQRICLIPSDESPWRAAVCGNKTEHVQHIIAMDCDWLIERRPEDEM